MIKHTEILRSMTKNKFYLTTGEDKGYFASFETKHKAHVVTIKT